MAAKAKGASVADTATGDQAIVNAFLKAGHKRESIILFDRNKTLAR